MRLTLILLVSGILWACSHPLEIVGDGDIRSSTGSNDCLLEAQPCPNVVVNDYHVTYTADPRSGWQFMGWEGCGEQHPDCTFSIPGNSVNQFWGQTVPPLRAVFTPAWCDYSQQVPTVMFVLDNSSNWAVSSQKWPGDNTQGQSAVLAIGQVLAARTGELNVGLVEYVTGGNSSDNDAGYVRYGLNLLDEQNQAAFNGVLDTIFSNSTGPEEQRNSNNAYGDLVRDLYNYLEGGYHSNGGAGTPQTLADPDAYISQWDRFESPLSAPDSCAPIFIIYIVNNPGNSAKADSTGNSTALKAAYTEMGLTVPDALAGDEGDPLPVAEFVALETAEPPFFGESAACWGNTDIDLCTQAENSPGGLCVSRYPGTCSCQSAPAENQNGCQTEGEPGELTFRREVVALDSITRQYIPSGDYDTTSGADYNLDDWAKYLHNHGIPLDAEYAGYGYTVRVPAGVSIIEIINEHQDVDFSRLLFNTAELGGGLYRQARSEEELNWVLQQVFGGMLIAIPFDK